MGWAILGLLMAAGFSGLWVSGVRGGLLTAALAVMMLGASGYALQGRPTLAGPGTSRAPRDGGGSRRVAKPPMQG